VVVDDFDIVCSFSFDPAEADAPLVIDPNAVLAFAVTPERFQVVAGNRA
jgi:hypothetical protein